MLDRAFLRNVFDQLDSQSDAELVAKIEQIEKHRLSFVRGSEARRDADFLLKHIRRELLERQFKPKAAT